MKQEIAQWLQADQKDYQAGLSLLTKYHKNKILVRNLAAHESPRNLENMIYQLSKLAEITPVVAAAENKFKILPKSEISNFIKTLVDAKAIDQTPADQDQTLKNLQKEVTDLHKEINLLIPGTDEFNKKAQAIKETQSKLKEILGQISNNEKAPADQTPADQDQDGEKKKD